MRIAFLDLDHTLLAADSNQLWMAHLLHLGLVSPAQVAAHERFVTDYAQGRLDFAALQVFRHGIDAALAPPELARQLALFEVSALFPAIARDTPRLLADLRTQGLLAVVVSATRQCLVQPVARHLGIPHVIAADSQPTVPAPCFGAGKVVHVEHWLGQRGSSLSALADSWFYSDSHNDLPLLQAVQHPVAVDPDAPLRRTAQDQGWPVITLRGV